MLNKKIAKILYDIADLLALKKGTPFKPRAYRKAANVLENLKNDVADIYKEKGIKGLNEIESVGKNIAEKIEECIKKGKIKYYEDLKKETAIQQIIAYYFKSKELSLQELKDNAKKRKIVYSRYTRSAKQLIELAGSIEKAKKAIDKVSVWAKSRDLDYSIETIFKKWLELDKLKPKEIVKKPFYDNMPMVWSETKKKWFVISPQGEWLEFADQESKIVWRIAK